MRKELRVAAIVALVQNAQARLGKTQVQKLVYFVQDTGVPLEYKYEIYHFGPYSFELASDLASLNSLHVLNVESDPGGFGFEISTGKFAAKFKLEPKYQKKVAKVIDQFGLNSAAQLEVKATIHFVHSIVRKRVSPEKIKSDVIKRVRALKPRFPEAFIRNCFLELQKMRWI